MTNFVLTQQALANDRYKDIIVTMQDTLSDSDQYAPEFVSIILFCYMCLKTLDQSLALKMI